MKTIAVVALLMGFTLAALPAAAEVAEPPAINMPAGGKIVTEINLSDNDVLGIAKQSIPAIADVLKEIAPAFTQHAGAPSSVDIAKLINLSEFSQAISGVSDVRLLIARYPRSMTPERFLSEFSAGVVKTGEFSKTLSDFGFFPGSVGVFCAPGNAGLIAFAYNPGDCSAYALRVVGGVDVPQLIHWSGQIAKFFVAKNVVVEENGPAPQPSGEPKTDRSKPTPHLEVK